MLLSLSLVSKPSFGQASSEKPNSPRCPNFGELGFQQIELRRAPRLNSAPSNVITTRFKVTYSLKHKPQNSLKAPQLDLFNCEPSLHGQAGDRHSADALPPEAIYATPSVCRQPGGHCWWHLRCSHSRKMFGGLYSIAERDHILEHFKGRQQRIDPHEFNPIADRAIAFYKQEVGL